MSTSGSLRVTTPSATEIAMTRTFEAPRVLVFDAFTRPELLRRWIGRPGDVMTVCEVDLRAGGEYRYVFTLRTRETFRETGTFREVAPPERIVSTESFDDYPGETVVTTTFAEHDGRTTMTTRSAFASQAVRDAVIASGVESGAGESYDRLAELLRSLRAGSRT